jgi:hypothetical protein
MSQAGYTPLSLYYSTTASAVPTSGNLVAGELAINILDGKLYYKNSAGTVALLASTSGASGDVVGPASSTDNALARFDLATGKLIQNSVGILSDAGILTGLTGITSSGSITLSSLTSGRVTYAGTSGLLQDSANLTFDGTNLTLLGGTANGVAYLNGSKVLTTGSALTYTGSTLSVKAGNGDQLVLNNAGERFTQLTFQNNGTTKANLNVDNTSSLYEMYGASGFSLLFSPNATEGMRLTSTGLGIGTSSPGARLTTQAAANSYVAGALQINSLSGTYKSYITNVGGSLLFSNSSTVDQLILDSSGNLQVGTTSASLTNTDSQMFGGSANNYSIFSHINGTGSGAVYQYFAYNATSIGSITQAGTTGVLYNVTSDQRLKENITDADSASSLIDALQVRKFDWKADRTHQRYGFIAQELVTVVPEAVHQPADTEAMMAVDYSKLVPMLVKEIQSLRKRLTALEST